MDLPIRLDQFLKRIGIAQTGGHAKYLISEGLVSINGEVVQQRGKKLYEGDQVACEGNEWIVSEENRQVIYELSITIPFKVEIYVMTGEAHTECTTILLQITVGRKVIILRVATMGMRLPKGISQSVKTSFNIEV